MSKRIVVGLILWTMAVSACVPVKPQVTRQPEVPLVSRNSIPMPPPLTVMTAIKMVHKPGYDEVWNYGNAIALGQGVLAVGAPDSLYQPGKQDGSVFIYKQEGVEWVEQAQLTSSDRQDGFQYDQHFGTALAMEGDLLFVGAPGADDRLVGDNTGAVYVFRNAPDGWQEIERLAVDPPLANANFGSLLAVSGDTLIVGETYTSTQVNIFQREVEGWRQQARLKIPLAEGFKFSGCTFALYGDSLAISAQYRQGEEDQTRMTSRVFIYETRETGWEQAYVLSSGWTIALAGSQGRAERLAVSKGGSQSGFGAGEVTIYERGSSGWEPRATLTAPDGKANDFFGSSLALDGDLLLVGASGASEDSFWDGVAYVFEYDQGRWVDQLRITPPEDGGSGDFFGSLVAARGSTLLVSAPNEFGNAVYVYDIGVRP
jgi:hypothetical protein